MKKRIAICLKGAIAKISGHFFTEGAVYQPGNYVNYRACFNSIQRHIVQANDCDFDFFIHSWNKDLENELTELYQPKASLFEDNTKYKEFINSKVRAPEDFGGISQSLSIKKSIELMEKYQIEHDFKYNQVIIYRPDLLLLKNIVLSKYGTELIYNNGNAPGDPQGDFHFVMSANNASLFKNLIDSIDTGNPHHLHIWINKYIRKYMNQCVISDDIIAGRDQEVLRKINFTTIKIHNLAIEKLFEYGLTSEEISQYNSP